MKQFLFLFAALFIISCQSSDDSKFKLDGKALGFTDGTKITVFQIDKNNQSKAIDTLIVKAELFSGSFDRSDELAINYLQAEGVKGTVLYFPENSDLKVTLFKDSITSSFVTGGKQNSAYKNYYDKITAFNKQKQANTERFKQARRDGDSQLASEIQAENLEISDKEKAYKILYISENSNSLFSVLLLSQMLNKKDISSVDAATLSSKFSPKVAATSVAKKLALSINSARKADVGGLAPEFSAKTPDGKTLALKDVLGKYTIIDFWASWCRPCRQENPNVVRVYNQYHNKGLNIISVSLDKAGQEDRWIKAIKDDKMNWHHVSNLKGWSDPIAQQYSVRSIPATFLLDENGKIIAKNLRGNALAAKIASLLGE